MNLDLNLDVNLDRRPAHAMAKEFRSGMPEAEGSRAVLEPVAVEVRGQDEPAKRPPLPHVTALDGFRGCAVLLVLLFHYLPRRGLGAFGLVASPGWTGVDAFLVLSAYLITSILYRQRGSERFYQNFYMRRALRLFPLYYFILFVALALSPLLHIHWRLGHLPFFLYGTNIALGQDQSLGALGPLNFHHLWTLALEEQFYLIWPWFIGSRLSRAALVRICWVGIALAFCLRTGMISHGHANGWAIYQDLPTRMDSLLFGALLALSPLPSARAAWIALLGALGVVTVIVLRADTVWFCSLPMMTFGYTALGLFYAAVLSLALRAGSSAARFLSLGSLRFFGRYSYGLYLWHYICSEQIDRWTAWMYGALPLPAAVTSLLCFVVILLGSTVVAVASYHTIEAPFLRLKLRYQA